MRYAELFFQILFQNLSIGKRSFTYGVEIGKWWVHFHS
ncbi:hypothetical protein LEP1GSC016_0345 [Leptospira borgpetersenii serovar Hardjo-bovis str. Sponselee]|uniref:Uncharacterized protein n=6 Tax=Leptospira borgpetersenii TaxID=174 RepID=M3FEM5_LEPBO|nr:hypothetical protein LEP1GSC128_1846 [Leptospira borgpetersenii str. 200801926]EKQ92418.1 hypothetical protein LEP1GSC101_2508 [Leptospira borgpetersenii str. UI 09149]EKQ99534.1 hypothetical protein LEP1GSC121_1800 [Leptospira borgpetersenii serovar Castellonis str. 200801910]EMG00328.1 hypothetical protein LEP1GSC123_2321 [Leptospira borgpetersenii str. 200701203]EMJ78395.1 hypothetical protein LEP1GSC016_0345 [Leptospira borgpetersenii serovar Hardjo-bovis str. Sponselee]EMK08462.1 hypot